MKAGSVQSVRLGVESISDGVVGLSDAQYRTALEVSGIASPFDDDVRQEAMQAAYTGFLNALSYPIQVLVRANPVDISRYVAAVEDRARHISEPQLVALAQDHVAFVQSLARQRMLLERRFYVVIPAESAPRLTWRGFWLRRRSRAAEDEPRREAASRQLAFRCEEVIRQLGRCGLAARRLSDLELAQLFVACWSPERARAQRFRQQLEDYTTLAVRAERPRIESQVVRAAV